MVVPDGDRADAASWAAAVLPEGRGLSPLSSALWNSREVRQAIADSSPGTIIALARQAHGLNQGQLGAMAGFSQSAISRLEAGGNLAFDVRVLRIFQRLLGIPPQLLGLSDDSVPLRVDDAGRLLGRLGGGDVLLAGRTTSGRTVPVAVSRHSLLAACTSSVFGGLPVDSSGMVDESRPVDPDLVRRLRVVRRLLNESDNWLGPANLAPAVHSIYDLTDRLRRSATGGMRRQLLHVAALYAEFSGWLHQEVGDVGSAAGWTEQALQQAQAADDSELVAYCFIRMGQLAEAEGDHDRVTGLARAAQRERNLSAEVQALALQQEARGHALAGDVSTCLARFDEASAVLRERGGQWTDEYQTGHYFTQHHLDVQLAACLLELGRPRDAIAIYQDRQSSRQLLCRWEQGLHLAKLARAYALSGQPEHAATIGFEALDVSQNTGSVLVTDELLRLGGWRDVPAIAALTANLRPAG